MNTNHRITVFSLLLIATLFLAACGGTSSAVTSAGDPPVVISSIEGSDLKQIVLSEQAAVRLDVQTVPVRNESVNGEQRLLVPYGALIYDLAGDTWVYTSPELHTFVREAVTVDFIDGDKAFLTKGPAVGTEVATVAVAELYGAETGVGK
jgi:hypothetical protein